MFSKKFVVPGFIGILLSFLVFSFARAASSDYLNLADSGKDQQLAAVLDGLKKQVELWQATIKDLLLANAVTTVVTTATSTPPPPPPPPPTAPTFSITAPSSGETVARGSSYAIKWQSNGVVSEVRMSLYKGGGFKDFIAIDVPNNGSYTWQVPSSLALGSDYSVRIFNLAFPDNYADSKRFVVDRRPLVFTEPPPPVFSSLEGERISFDVAASDPEGGAVTLSAAPLREGAFFYVKSSSQRSFVWDTDYTQAGVYRVEFTAKDSNGLRKITAISTITVVDVPSGPPLIRRWDLGRKTVKVGRVLNVIVTASDPEGASLQFSFGTTTPPAGVSFLPYGDVSMNGQTIGYDAALLLQHLAGKLSLSAEQKVLAEVTGDGKLTKEDAKWIQEATVSLRQLTGNRRVFNWIPSKAIPVGSHKITVVVTDPDNLSDVASIEIVVSK